MSSKAMKKYGQACLVPAESLAPADKDGWLTKQGGTYKTWKKRWCILKGKTLYYYKSQKDSFFTGRVELQATSLVKEEPDKKKKPNMFSISTAKRIFFMSADKPEVMKAWVEALSNAISPSTSPPIVATPVVDSGAQQGQPQQGFQGLPPSQEDGPSLATPPPQQDQQQVQPTQQQPPRSSPGFSVQQQPPPQAAGEAGPRVRMNLIKQFVNFLQDEESKVLEFYNIWTESIPHQGAIGPNDTALEFHVATSADIQKLSWRFCGPQNLIIQNMVDFFWNVGAPESEIDRLNDVGASVNPLRIGSWIDMSGKGGMDGGWYFPIQIPLRTAVDSMLQNEENASLQEVDSWLQGKEVTSVIAIGRDMGAAPPRQTDFRFNLPGAAYRDQVEAGLEAWEKFGFPPMPQEAMDLLKNHSGESGCLLNVITSSDGFVRIGILTPRPPPDLVTRLVPLASGSPEQLAAFEKNFPAGTGPSFVEFQWLMRGFGYGVYKEGFDIVFHYLIGEETG